MTRSHGIQREAAPAVMVHPDLAGLRALRTAMFVCIALCILSFVGLLVFSMFSRLGLHLLLSTPFNPFSLAGYFTIPLIVVLIQIRFHKRLEQRRQRAAKGDQSLLAVEQPAPNTKALPLPTTISQRPKWSTLLLLPGILLALMVVLALLLIIPPSNGQALPQSNVFILAGSLIATLLLCGLLIRGLYAGTREQITVTEHGLIKVGLLRKVHSVSWEEARLFAIDGIFGSMKYPHPILYELSSAHEVVRWGWMRRNNMRVIFISQPTISAEEYERQMQGLLSLIAARTGLPLYDLR